MIIDFSIKPKIDKNFILSRVSQENIFSYYLHLPELNKKLIRSPFREDNHPTCGIYKSSSGTLYLHDFAINKHYNCFSLVMEKYGCSYFQALKIIANDFHLVESENISKNKVTLSTKPVETKKDTLIQVKVKEFTNEELEWWGKYGITKKILRKYNVFSCDTVFLNNNVFAISNNSNPTYGYYGGKNGSAEYWRIYFPKRKEYRFISNFPAKKLQGYKQLPNKGNLLVITKSQKDVMTYYSLGISAVAPCSETLFITDSLLEELKSRFKYIVVHYDNDRPGKYNMAKIRRLHPELKYFFIPNSYDAKDISDFYKKYGKSKTIEFLKNNILQLKDGTLR